MKKKNKKSKQRLQYITEGRKAATGDRAIFGGERTDGRNAISRIFFSTRRVVGYFFPVCTICEKTRGARMIEPKLMVWLSHKRKEGSNKRAMMLLSSRAEKTDKNSSIVHPFAPRCFSGIGNKCKDGDNNDNSCCSLQLPGPSAGIHLPRIVASPSFGTASSSSSSSDTAKEPSSISLNFFPPSPPDLHIRFRPGFCLFSPASKFARSVYVRACVSAWGVRSSNNNSNHCSVRALRWHGWSQRRQFAFPLCCVPYLLLLFH